VLSKNLFIISCLVVLGAAPTTQETNLLPNGGFEKGMDGWTLGNDYNMSRLSPEAAHSGTRGLRVKDENAEQGSSLSSQKFITAPGKAYMVKFYARRIAEGSVNVYIRFFDKAGKSLNTQQQNNQNSTSIKKGEQGEMWQQYISDPAIAPENAATVVVYIHSANAQTGAVDFDDFVFTEIAASP
jgi:hypothetical protein